jgi:hypothetical protein
VLIQRRGDELLCIAQTDHAALAADIMAGWTLDSFTSHPRRDAILAATRAHDDGWREEDAQLHVTDAGELLDFIAVPPAVKHRIWPRAAERLAAASPYTAALVAEHALAIHAPLRQDPAWRAFFASMQRIRDGLLARLPPEEAAAAPGDYGFLRIGDQLSLIFCNGWTTPMAGIGYRAILNGVTLEITPDPFDGQRIPLKIDARKLSARACATADDFRKALAAASTLVLEGEALGRQA